MREMVDWYQFKNNVIEGINRGEISFSDKISEFDLAINYATCILWNKGIKKFTPEQIWDELNAHVPDVHNLSKEEIYG